MLSTSVVSRGRAQPFAACSTRKLRIPSCIAHNRLHPHVMHVHSFTWRMPQSCYSAVPPARRGVATRSSSADTGTQTVTVVDRLKADTIAAMKAKEAAKLASLRFLSSAIKNREIELRTDGKVLTQRDALEVAQKLIKQSKQVIDDFTAAGRPEAATEEEAKVKVWEQYLPAALSAAELEALVDGAIAEVGATTVKQMGQVMKLVVDRAENRADNKQISEMVKARLTAKK